LTRREGSARLSRMSRRKQTPEQRAAKLTSGSKDKVLSDVKRYEDNPDALMVSHGLAGSIQGTRNMNLAPSKMYEDGGRKMSAVQYLAHRAYNTKCPNTPEGMFTEAEAYLGWCAENTIPPTIGGFSVWCGVTVQRFDQIARNKTNEPLAHSAEVVKEIIRNFLEISAMDSSLNPIIYFHMNKVYYGAVENAQVTVRIDDNSREISPEEYAERVVLLTQGEDGVYRAEGR
jgi:hypothetical protein